MCATRLSGAERSGAYSCTPHVPWPIGTDWTPIVELQRDRLAATRRRFPLGKAHVVTLRYPENRRVQHVVESAHTVQPAAVPSPATTDGREQQVRQCGGGGGVGLGSGELFAAKADSRLAHARMHAEQL